jgi:hypothetical protein
MKSKQAAVPLLDSKQSFKTLRSRFQIQRLRPCPEEAHSDGLVWNSETSIVKQSPGGQGARQGREGARIESAVVARGLGMVAAAFAPSSFPTGGANRPRRGAAGQTRQPAGACRTDRGHAASAPPLRAACSGDRRGYK